MNILIATGEVSGDLYGAMVAEELKKYFKEPKIYAVGSGHLANAGAQIVYDSVKYSSVGVVESIKQGGNIIKMMKEIKKFISSSDLDIAIMIDNQGVNMPLIDYIHKVSPKTKVYYFIPPQEWLWGTQKGGKDVLAKLDKIFCIFQKEYDFYSQLEPSKTVLVGHPLVGLLREKKAQFIADGKKVKDNLIGLFPGSRIQEIRNLLPIILETANILNKKDPTLEFKIALSSEHYRDTIESSIKDYPNVKISIYNGQRYELMYESKVLLMASGTVTFEAGIMGKVGIGIYKIHPFSYWLAEKFVNIKYVLMPNILANRQIMTELLQGKANPGDLADIIYGMLKNDNIYGKAQQDIDSLQDKLQSGDVSLVAKTIYEDINGSI